MNWWRSAFFSWEMAFFLLCWLGLAFAFQERAFIDPGALWHVRVGEMILDSGFMTQDPFTFTFAEQTWIPQQWGGEISMALAHRLAGFDAMLLGLCVLMAGTWTWIFSRALQQGMHPILAGLLIGGTLITAAFHFYARPHMVTLSGMAMTLMLIADVEAKRCTIGRLAWLIPLGVVWSNIHGGVLGGVATFGFAVCCWMILLILPRPSWTWWPETPLQGMRDLFFVCAVLLAFLLTPFINPFGMEMLHTWQKIVGSAAMKELVSEHQPLSIHHTAGQVVVGLGAVYALLLLGVSPKRWRITWLLPIIWFLLSLKGIRQGPLFAVLAGVAIADLWPHTIWHRLLLKYGDTLAREPQLQPRKLGWMLGATVLTLGTLFLQVQKVPVPLLGSGWARLNPQAVPVELIPELRQYADSVPAGTPIFNDANLGGFVIYHAPTLKVFMDDRFELYGDDWLWEYVEIAYNNPARFEEWSRQYCFQLAILKVEPERVPLEKYLCESDSWIEVARCQSGVIFRRRPQ